MTNQTQDFYFNHPLFYEAMGHFQVGAWETGLTQLDELRNHFPLDDALRSLRQEMQLKSKIDEYEISETKIARKQLIKNLAIRTVIAITVVGLMIWGGLSYSTWIQQQWDVARQRVQSEALAIDLSIQFRNAQNLLLAGRPTEAKAIFEEIGEVSPDFPELEYFLSEAEAMILLNGQYDEAMVLLNQGNTEEALSIFKDIAAEKPLYKDVSLLINNIERGYLLDGMVAEADVAFQEENWEEAISAYESILALNPAENLDEIEEHLFLSYISAAETKLDDPEGTIEALETAEEYFKKALVLRPQNEEVLEKWAEARETIKIRLINSYIEEAQLLLSGREDSLEALSESVVYLDKALKLQPEDENLQKQADFVQNYLKAIDAYRKNNWAAVIILLEPVIEEDLGFANGTALQTLYEAYIARGNDAIVGGIYEVALADYQRAAVIAQQSTESAILVFEAQIKAAQAQGLLFNYEGAVALYQSAVELLAQETNLLTLTLKGLLSEAESYAAEGNFRSAYLSYKETLDDNQFLYENAVTYVVQENEYLTMIANRYNTTVQAIVRANGIKDPNIIVTGREIIIPTLDK